MNNIGILGGSFNPIHNGHEYIALEVLKKLNLKKIILLPNANPPHKQIDLNVSYEHRCNMVNIIVNKYNEFEISYIEKSSTIHYTVNTLKQLKKFYKNSNLYFIIGEDSLKDLPNWYEPKEIFEYANIVAFPRKNSNFNDFMNLINKTKKELCENIIPINVEPMEISSTSIRKLIQNNMDITTFVDKNVKEYIYEHRLYKL